MKSKNLIYNLNKKTMNLIAASALMVTAMATNASCLWFFGQDEIPKNSKKLRRF